MGLQNWVLAEVHQLIHFDLGVKAANHVFRVKERAEMEKQAFEVEAFIFLLLRDGISETEDVPFSQVMIQATKVN